MALDNYEEVQVREIIQAIQLATNGPETNQGQRRWPAGQGAADGVQPLQEKFAPFHTLQHLNRKRVRQGTHTRRISAGVLPDDSPVAGSRV